MFSKILLFFASILAIVSGPNYIKLGADNLIFDFKTGGNYPIYYYLNLQNIGPGTERFEISSGSAWVSGYREGTGYNFVELSPQAYINFVLEIHPERLADGVNKTKIKLKVLDIDSLVSQEMVLDEEEISVTVNKNIVSTPSLPILSPTTSEEQNRGSSISQPSPEGSGEIGTTPVSTLQPAQAPPTDQSDLSSVLKQLQSLIDSLRTLLMKFF